MFPSGYTKYIKACKNNGHSPDISLARYATRYKMAGQLESIKLLDHSETSQKLYLHAFRISLAYSALESLEEYLLDKLAIKDIKIANLVRKSSAKTRVFFLTQANKKLRNSLQKFFESANNSDLKPFCTALRHSMFHGQFNPSASGLNNASGLSLLFLVETALFEAINKASESEFRKLMEKYK